MRTELFALVAIAVCATGCAGARTSVVADSAQYPISMSRAVRDADGEIVPADQLEKVGDFHETQTAWGIAYSALPLTPHRDISDAVNTQTADKKGQAVVNLTISAKNCPFNMIYPLTMLPFWPGCTKLEMKGDIVRVVSLKAAQR